MDHREKEAIVISLLPRLQQRARSLSSASVLMILIRSKLECDSESQRMMEVRALWR